MRKSEKLQLGCVLSEERGKVVVSHGPAGPGDLVVYKVYGTREVQRSCSLKV